MLPEAEKKIGDHDYIVWSLNFTTPSLAKLFFTTLKYPLEMKILFFTMEITL